MEGYYSIYIYVCVCELQDSIFCMPAHTGDSLGNNTDVIYLLFFPRSGRANAELFFLYEAFITDTWGKLLASLSFLPQQFVPHKSNH